jgi:hypothetical protein
LGPRAGLGGCGEEKISLLPLGFQLLTVQPSHFTDYAIPGPQMKCIAIHLAQRERM